jgi:pre-mRNA-processing factor 40
LKEKNVLVTGSSKVEELLEATSSHPKFQLINPRNVQIIFPKLIEKAAEEKKKMEKETERKRKKVSHNFLDLLNSNKNVRAYSTYKEVREHLADHPAFIAIESEEEKESLFNEYISKRKEDSSDEVIIYN